MTGPSETLEFYREKLSEAPRFSAVQIVLGFIGSTLIMVGSTWGLLYILDAFGAISITLSDLIPYTMWMLVGSFAATLVGVIVNGILLKFPGTATVPLGIHRFFKRRTGEYFVSPEKSSHSYSILVRRSLYGSILVVGIALTILSFDLMTNVQTPDILAFGAWVVVLCTAILPIIILLFYYGPWLLKDAGLFHLDHKDRSLSNVGDDLEDILEFVAGVDLVLVWLELTINTYADAPWLSLFVILVALGPLFAIVLNFTLIFMVLKDRTTLNMIELLLTRYDTADIYSSSDSIKSNVMALLETSVLSFPDEPHDYEESSDSE